MFSTKFVLALVSSITALTVVNANGTGWGKHWDPKGQVPCGNCPATTRAVALPSDQFPNPAEKCCHTVRLSFNGHNVDSTFTHLYLRGAHSQNITMTDATFSDLAPLSELEIFPVVWNLN